MSQQQERQIQIAPLEIVGLLVMRDALELDASESSAGHLRLQAWENELSAPHAAALREHDRRVQWLRETLREPTH